MENNMVVEDLLGLMVRFMKVNDIKECQMDMVD